MHASFSPPEGPADISQQPAVKRIISAAIEEDLAGREDVTSAAVIPSSATAQANLVAREPCVVAGAYVAREVFLHCDPGARVDVRVFDGLAAQPGDLVLSVEGRARALLTAERTALNFIQRLSGIATLTKEYAKRVHAHKVKILDTRKTTPNLRVLEKYAVRCGGGENHRMGLHDRVMIKDNHRDFQPNGGALAQLVDKARRRYPELMVEVEADSVDQFRDALAAEPDWILLDNMSPDELQACVKLNAGSTRLEASGGVTLDSVQEIAATGVDAISVGALTHSARSIDLALEIVA